MDNLVSIKAPTISTVDKDGVQWTFDPEAQKWFASFEGKKFNSKDYSTVQEKMALHRSMAQSPTASAKAPAVETPQVIEVAMLSIHLESSGSQPIDFTREKIRVEPVVAKVEWDAKKNAPAIVRYKEKDSGWQSSGADRLILFHPNFMDNTMRKFFEQSIEGRMFRNSYEKAEETIAQAWWGAKDETRESYTIGMSGFVKEQSTHYDRHSTRSAPLSSAWSMSLEEKPENPEFGDWTQQKDGSLKRGDVTVSMDTTERFSPTFRVKANGFEDPVFSSRDLRSALIMGNATHEMLCSPDRQSVQTWVGTHEWNKNIRAGSWPKMFESQWATILPHKEMHRSSYIPMSYAFGRFAKQEGEQGYVSPHDQDPTQLAWHQARQGYGGVSYRLAGPEDAALDTMAALRRKFETLSRDNGLMGVEMSRIREIFSGTLPDLYNATIDGEEVASKDPVPVKAAFENLTRSIRAKIEARGSVSTWQTECSQAMEQASKIIASPPKEKLAKSPKPR